MFKKLFSRSDVEEVASLRAQLAAANELLALAERVVTLLEDGSRGQVAAIALLERRNDESFRNGLVIQACLLTTQGGAVTVSKDIIAALETADISIEHKPDADGNILFSLVETPEEEVELECGCTGCEDHACQN